MMSEERKQELVEAAKRHLAVALQHIDKLETISSDDAADIVECLSVAVGEITGYVKGRMEIAGFHQEEIEVILYNAEMKGYKAYQECHEPPF
jgi:hypothetical protein